MPNEVLPFSWQRVVDSGIEVLFLATPHEQSREWVPEAIAHEIKVIDLSGAWRLKTPHQSRCISLDGREPRTCRKIADRGNLRMPGTPPQRDPRGPSRSQPRMLRHLSHPRARAAASSRSSRTFNMESSATQSQESVERARRRPRTLTSCMLPTISRRILSLDIATPENCSNSFISNRIKFSSLRIYYQYRVESCPRFTFVSIARRILSKSLLCFKTFTGTAQWSGSITPDAYGDSTHRAH